MRSRSLCWASKRHYHTPVPGAFRCSQAHSVLSTQQDKPNHRSKSKDRLPGRFPRGAIEARGLVQNGAPFNPRAARSISSANLTVFANDNVLLSFTTWVGHRHKPVTHYLSRADTDGCSTEHCSVRIGGLIGALNELRVFGGRPESSSYSDITFSGSSSLPSLRRTSRQFLACDDRAWMFPPRAFCKDRQRSPR